MALLPGGKLSVITSQPRIAGEAATPDEIEALMLQKGFQKLTEGAYLDRGCGLLIYDLFPRNVVRSGDGTLYPIDLV